MKLILAGLAIVFLFFSDQSDAKATYNNVSVSERKLFNIGFLAGQGESRVLNSDGSFAAYSGMAFAIEPNYGISTLDDKKFYLFLRYQTHDQKSKNNSNFTLLATHTLLGFKAFIGKFFYLGAGYGSEKLDFKTTTGEFSVSTTGPSIGMGYEFDINEQFGFGVNLWYANAPIKYESVITSNSYIENYNLTLNFNWSPFTTYDFKLFGY